MSKPRLRIEATIDTKAHGMTIIESLSNRLVGKQIFEIESFSVDPDEKGRQDLIVDIQFNKDVDRDDIKDWIRGQFINHNKIKRWASKSRILWYRCTHDDKVVKSCNATNFFEWSK